MLHDNPAFLANVEACRRELERGAVEDYAFKCKYSTYVRAMAKQAPLLPLPERDESDMDWQERAWAARKPKRKGAE